MLPCLALRVFMPLTFRVLRQWLDVFKQAHEGDVRLQRILGRYGSMIAAKRENEKWKQLVRNQLVSAHLRSKHPTPFIPDDTRPPFFFSPFIQMEENMMRHRAILTGTFQRATYYNKPLPRMKVQPLHVSGMIQKRLRARERRRDQHWTLLSWAKHMETEARFEKTLEKDAARFGQTFTSVFQHEDWRESSPCPSRIKVEFLL